MGPKLQYKEQKQKTYVQQVSGEVAQVPLDHLLVNQRQIHSRAGGWGGGVETHKAFSHRGLRQETGW